MIFPERSGRVFAYYSDAPQVLQKIIFLFFFYRQELDSKIRNKLAPMF